MGNRIYNSPAKMSMHFLVAKCVMLQTQAFQRTFVVDILVDIMLCGRYLVNFVMANIYFNPTSCSVLVFYWYFVQIVFSSNLGEILEYLYSLKPAGSPEQYQEPSATLLICFPHPVILQLNISTGRYVSTPSSFSAITPIDPGSTLNNNFSIAVLQQITLICLTANQFIMQNPTQTCMMECTLK